MTVAAAKPVMITRPYQANNRGARAKFRKIAGIPTRRSLPPWADPASRRSTLGRFEPRCGGVDMRAASASGSGERVATWPSASLQTTPPHATPQPEPLQASGWRCLFGFYSGLRPRSPARRCAGTIKKSPGSSRAGAFKHGGRRTPFPESGRLFQPPHAASSASRSAVSVSPSPSTSPSGVPQAASRWSRSAVSTSPSPSKSAGCAAAPPSARQMSS